MNAVLHHPSSDQKQRQKTRWVRVALLTLTSPNLTPLDLHKKEVLSFLSRLSCRFRVHLAVAIGSEDGVTHSHLVVAVPANEVERFRTNAKKHRIAAWWNNQHDPVMKPWDASLADRGMTYTSVKHQLWDEHPSVFCPKKAHRCERGNCPHR